MREGVQRGILEALKRDRELSGVWMVVKLTIAGAAGVATALCALLLFGGHTLGRESAVHVVLCGIAWTGLLVVCFTLLMLRIRVRHLSVVQMVAVGVVGLVFAALLLLACPEPRSLDWWQATPVGRSITAVAGPSLSAFLLAGMAAALASGLATLVVQARAREIASPRASAAISFLLLLPGVVLQSLGGPRSVAIALIIGTVLGAYGGISSALAVTRRRPSRD